MYICWQKNSSRFFSNDTMVIVESNGDIHAIDTNAPFTPTATNIHAVGTIAEALHWLKTGNVSGVTGD
jgi:hypothetical protein